MNDKRELKVALIQTNSKRSFEDNLKRLLDLIDKIPHDVDLITTPENVLYIGPDRERVELASEIWQKAIDTVSRVARKRGCFILLGSLPEKVQEGRIYNTSVLIDSNGNICTFYRKIHLFDVDLGGGIDYRESETVERGNRPVFFDLKGWRLGFSICYDLRFPELYRILFKEGAELLLVPSAFTLETGKDHWYELVRARAIENLSYVIAPAQCGRHSKNRRSYGNSCVVDPWGKVIYSAGELEWVFGVSVLDKEYLNRVRNRIPCRDHICLL